VPAGRALAMLIVSLRCSVVVARPLELPVPGVLGSISAGAGV